MTSAVLAFGADVYAPDVEGRPRANALLGSERPCIRKFCAMRFIKPDRSVSRSLAVGEWRFYLLLAVPCKHNSSTPSPLDGACAGLAHATPDPRLQAGQPGLPVDSCWLQNVTDHRFWRHTVEAIRSSPLSPTATGCRRDRAFPCSCPAVLEGLAYSGGAALAADVPRNCVSPDAAGGEPLVSPGEQCVSCFLR